VGSALMMAAVLPFQMSVATSPLGALAIFCLIALAAGMRTPASGGLGLAQLPAHPGAMMAARTAATQLGYLLGAVIGGAVIAGEGYGALGFVLAAGMAVSALLILRVEDPSRRAAKSPESPPGVELPTCRRPNPRPSWPGTVRCASRTPAG
jgi:predicted MFS family arabinose efflux permease